MKEQEELFVRRFEGHLVVVTNPIFLVDLWLWFGLVGLPRPGPPLFPHALPHRVYVTCRSSHCTSRL